MDATILVIFGIVYLGMILGGLPGLALDRTGVALLGAIALIALGKVSAVEAWDAVDVPTIGLLFGLMVISSQFRLGGFYAALAGALARAGVGPVGLLALLTGAVGALSAVLGNDIICLAMTPVLVDGCRKRRLNPAPYLFALAAASNVGSAATLIGNPQNVLIGEALKLDFAAYLLDGGVPAALGLVVVWAVIAAGYRGRWTLDAPATHAVATPFDAWQTAKGGVVLVALMGLFLFSAAPRDVVALLACGLLLLSRRMASRSMLGLVDWHLLVLFVGLFVVNHAFQACGALAHATQAARDAGVPLDQPITLFVATGVLSNVVSNVPAVMLLLPSATHPLGGPILALSSTLAGNLIVVGSIANIIVFEQASQVGVRLRWADHAAVGVPITLLTLGIAAWWLWVCAG